MGQTGGVGYAGSWWLGGSFGPGFGSFPLLNPQAASPAVRGRGFRPTPPAITQPRLWPVQHGRRDREGLTRQHRSLEVG